MKPAHAVQRSILRSPSESTETPRERPSHQSFSGQAASPVKGRVALPWIALNALLLAVVLCAKPAPQSAPHGAPAPAPTRTPLVVPAPSVAQLALPGPPRPERVEEPLEAAAVIALEGRLFALERTPTAGRRAAFGAARPGRTLLLPGGGTLTVTRRASSDGELGEDTWTVVTDEGACLVQPSGAVELLLDTGEPEASLERFTGAELEGCAVPLGTTDRALAIRGAHPEARLDSFEARGSCEGAHPTLEDAALPRALLDGFDPEARIVVAERELVLLRSAGDDAGLRVVERRGTETTLLVDEPFSPLWSARTREDLPDC